MFMGVHIIQVVTCTCTLYANNSSMHVHIQQGYYYNVVHAPSGVKDKLTFRA